MIYVIQAEVGGPVKIGYTVGETVDARLATIQACCPFPLVLLHAMQGTVADELSLHRKFAARRLHGEWFDPGSDLIQWLGEQGAVARLPVDVMRLPPPPIGADYGPLVRADQAIVDWLEAAPPGWALSRVVAAGVGMPTVQVAGRLRWLHGRHRIRRRISSARGHRTFWWSADERRMPIPSGVSDAV